MPLFDKVGKAVRVAPAQMGATGLKVGVTAGLTTMVKVTGLAHCPTPGVKVYVVVSVLFNAGAHVPLMPFCDKVGRAANASPAQMGATAAKLGVTTLPMVVMVVAAVLVQPLISLTVTV